MSLINWDVFQGLPGSATTNFENLCRAIVRQHYGRYGQFAALANQPGVEFHLKLHTDCPLGAAGNWFGWQCRWYDLPSGKAIGKTRRDKIEKALKTSIREIPELTDWVLWTRHALTKSDQEWFLKLTKKVRLAQRTSSDVEPLLSGGALFLRQTYFGELILTPDSLAALHAASTARIRARWMPEVHQTVKAERLLRQMLGEPTSWDSLAKTASELEVAASFIEKSLKMFVASLSVLAKELVDTADVFASSLREVHTLLQRGDFELVRQRLSNRPKVPFKSLATCLRQMRAMRLSSSLGATNTVADVHLANQLLREISDRLETRLVAVVAGPGGGKTQLAAQLTAATSLRPAGLLLHGQDLHATHGLDDLARRTVIHGSPVQSMESLLAAVNAAGERARRRLPIVIDGLNEAEDPRKWKAELAVLDELLRSFPYVMVVCTVRTDEFADESLPAEVLRLEIPNFGEDMDEAVQKYFNHYLINPADADVPIEALSSPLNLRLYCEVANPTRDKWVGIEAIPESLTALFDKYLDNATERISALSLRSHRYYPQDVRQALSDFGDSVWDNKSRGVDEVLFRKKIGDYSRPWDESLVRALEQDAVFIRVSGDSIDHLTPSLQLQARSVEPSLTSEKKRGIVVMAIYDAIAGHLIADSLILKHGTDGMATWLHDKNTIAQLTMTSSDSHPLATDIFRSLVGLIPRRLHGRQLWQMLDGPLRTSALGEAAKLERSYIDSNTVNEIRTLATSTGKQFQQLAPRLWRLRSAIGHPLNANFIDSVLRSMTMADRDLCWTEWIRQNRTVLHTDLQQLEMTWRVQKERFPASRLRAKWAMWTLTSTVRKLRDQATRTLYWFGRGDPAALFSMTVESLDINDPYVPERMLAAAYGVAMAHHKSSLIADFSEKILPEFATKLFEMMFADGAPHSTSHVLMRDYAGHIITLAQLHRRKLLSGSDKLRICPPFPGSPKRKWGSVVDPYHGGYAGPIHMDFGNYTIGRLVEGRGNYDYTHPEYQSVVQAIRWRIEDLGFNEERFRPAEKNMGEESLGYGRTEYEGKIDRYGKKYSWIAFFEMAGVRVEEGKLQDRYEQKGRVPEVDIDPSFPDPVPLRTLIPATLSDQGQSLSEWVKCGDLPKVRPLLAKSDFETVAGAWVLLDGYFYQRDEDTKKAMICQLRNLMMTASAISEFQKYRGGGGGLDHSRIDKPSLYYTFVGEAGWADTFPALGSVSLEIQIGKKTVKRAKVPAYSFRFEDGTADQIEGEDTTSRPKYMTWEKPIYRTIKTFIPVVDNGWESYHSSTNPGDCPSLIGREICAALNLHVDQQTSEFYDADGRQASLIIKCDRASGASQEFIYLRQDLYDRFLKLKGLGSLWVIWGERELYSKNNDELQDLYSQHGTPVSFQDMIEYVAIGKNSTTAAKLRRPAKP